MTDPLASLQQRLGYRFQDRQLLELALRHRSCGPVNNERLEFLGDSVFNHLVALELYRRHPAADEGELSRTRDALVRGETLAEVARELQLDEALSLGSAERRSGVRRRGSVLADALEAVLGAVLLDGGIDASREALHRWFGERLESASPVTQTKDAKSRLQERLQGRGAPLPDYALVASEGKDHDKLFTVACRLQDDKRVVEAQGSSRRRAEQAAAQKMLELLGE